MYEYYKDTYVYLDLTKIFKIWLIRVFFRFSRLLDSILFVILFQFFGLMLYGMVLFIETQDNHRSFAVTIRDFLVSLRQKVSRRSTLLEHTIWPTISSFQELFYSGGNYSVIDTSSFNVHNLLIRNFYQNEKKKLRSRLWFPWLDILSSLCIWLKSLIKRSQIRENLLWNMRWMFFKLCKTGTFVTRCGKLCLKLEKELYKIGLNVILGSSFLQCVTQLEPSKYVQTSVFKDTFQVVWTL